MDVNAKPKVNRLTNAQVIRLADWLRANAARFEIDVPTMAEIADGATASLAFAVSDQQVSGTAKDCGVRLRTKAQAQSTRGVAFLVSQIVAIDDRLRCLEQQLGVTPGQLSPALRAAAEKQTGSLFAQE